MRVPNVLKSEIELTLDFRFNVESDPRSIFRSAESEVKTIDDAQSFPIKNATEESCEIEIFCVFDVLMLVELKNFVW